MTRSPLSLALIVTSFEDVVFIPAVMIDRAVRPQVWEPPEYFDQAPVQAR
jgi:hypothetical protein